MNAFVAEEGRCSSSLPLLQAKKLVNAAWKVADHGKDEVIVSDVLSSSASDGETECVTKSCVAPVPKFPSDTKFPSDVLILTCTLLFLRPKIQYSGIRLKCDLCSDVGEGEGVAPM